MWSESIVRELSDVLAEARKKGEVVHYGRIFGFTVLKNVDLPETVNGKPRPKGEAQGCVRR